MNTLCLTLASLAAAAAPATPTPTPSASARFTAGHSARIPIEIAGSGLVFVRARVREVDTWLLVSSGSPSLLSTRVATQASLSGEPGTFSSLPAELLHDVTVDLPGVTLTQATVSSLNLDPMQTSLGHPIGGILGIPFFESFVIILDYARGQLELHDAKTFAPSGTGTAIPITREAGLPYARARLKLPERDRFDGSFLIDSGADNARHPVLAFRLLEPPPRSRREAGCRRNGEPSARCCARRRSISSVSLCDSPVVNLSRSTQGTDGGPWPRGTDRRRGALPFSRDLGLHSRAAASRAQSPLPRPVSLRRERTVPLGAGSGSLDVRGAAGRSRVARRGGRVRRKATSCSPSTERRSSRSRCTESGDSFSGTAADTRSPSCETDRSGNFR